MEQNCYDSELPVKHISVVAQETSNYICARKNKDIIPLKSRWNKFNKMCNGGIEPGCVYTIAGMSGSGKSAMVNTLETDLIELNLNQDLVILSFSFEMLSSMQIGRKLSNKLKMTTSEMYSAEKELEDSKLQKVNTEIENLKKYPIYYVDEAISVNKIGKIITNFQETIAKDKWLIVILDHTLLVEGNDTSDERKIIIALEKIFIKLKKVGKTSIIQLTQLNRNIESTERILNSSAHYPMRSDLSSSDSIFQGSDVVAVLSRPELLGITQYGPNKLSTKNKIYLHFLKVREGKLAILSFENNLQYNNLIEN